jgi:peptidoglycan/xylan/chitin deacetylase (PgdA/CDA1 family)
VLDVSDLGFKCGAKLPLTDSAGRVRAIMALIGELKYRQPQERLELCRMLQMRAGVACLPDDLMMRSDQVLTMHRAGMQIGAHTITHPILARLEPGAMANEIQRGKAHLQDIIAAPVSMFAYPNGKPSVDYNEVTVKLVRDAGFRAAVSTAWGISQGYTDIFQLPRFTPWDVSSLRFGLRLLANLRRRAELLPTVPA